MRRDLSSSCVFSLEKGALPFRKGERDEKFFPRARESD
jgi:hypothetical protein